MHVQYPKSGCGSAKISGIHELHTCVLAYTSLESIDSEQRVHARVECTQYVSIKHMIRDAQHDVHAVLVYFTPHDCHSSGEKQKLDSPTPSALLQTCGQNH